MNLVKKAKINENNTEIRNINNNINYNYNFNDLNSNKLAFIAAAKEGNLEAIDHLLAITIDEHARDKMVHAYQDKPFFVAFLGGHLSVMERLLEVTPDPSKKGLMLDYVCRDSQLLAQIVAKYSLNATQVPTQWSGSNGRISNTQEPSNGRGL